MLIRVGNGYQFNTPKRQISPISWLTNIAQIILMYAHLGRVTPTISTLETSLSAVQSWFLNTRSNV